MIESDFETREAELQQQLKQLCDCNGRENHLRELAFIFNKLGLLYQCRSPDKISLIQSAALFNAAIVRHPENPKFQHDLHHLCTHILTCPKANEKVSLPEVSQTVAIQVREMRIQASKNLKLINKISENWKTTEKLTKEKDYCNKVKSSQINVSLNFKQIMALISKKCIEIMGQPPREFALAGMRSRARNEISPYFAFEHVLTLNNFCYKQEQQGVKKAKEYFRRYSVISLVIVINLQETNLYSVCIPSLNDHNKPGGNWFHDRFTAQGISFDGMMPHAYHFR